MDENKNLTPENAQTSENGPLMEKLESIETLLVAQQKTQKKSLHYRQFSTFLLLCLVVVVGIGLFNIVGTLEKVTADLPALVENINNLVDHLNNMDFDSLNSTVANLEKGLSAIDFEQLSASIKNLAQVTESLANVTRFFGG